MRDAHCRTAQYVAWSNEHRKAAQPLNDRVDVCEIGHVEPARLVDAQLVEQGTELTPVLRTIYVLGTRAKNIHTSAMQLHREVVRYLAPHAHYDAVGSLALVNVEDQLQAHLVKDQAVTNVVVG